MDDIERGRIDDWSRDIWNYRPGGGESAQMVAGRWDRWLDRVTRGGGGDVVAVTHAGVIRVALARSGPTASPRSRLLFPSGRSAGLILS